MIALVPKTYSCSVNISENTSKNISENIARNTTATKCKGYSKQEKLYFEEYFDVYTERKTIQGTNNNMQMKKESLEERLVMINISIVKNELTPTHTKYRVSKDFSTCTPLFLDVNE
jgi:hypothetical protein